MNRREFLAALSGAGQGAAMDFGDELYGALRGGYDAYDRDEKFEDEYKKRRDEARGFLKAIEAENPKAYMAGDIGGSIASAFVPVPGMQAKALASAPLLKRAFMSALSGGVGAAGRSDADSPEMLAKDIATGAAMSAGTAIGMDQFMRRIGDVIDFKKMKDKKLSSKDSGDGWFTDKVEKSLEKEKKKGLTGNLGKLTPEMMAENNKRAMKEARLDRGKSADEFSDPRKIKELIKVDGDLNVARNKAQREYEKILNEPDYGENSYLRPRGRAELKSMPPKDDMDFTEFAKALERGEKYHPEDAMKDSMERDRWDIFRAQANMADKSEAADRLEAMAGKYSADKQIFDQVDDLRNKANRWKDSSERWSDDLSDIQKRVDAGEKIPGINRPELSFEERADKFAKDAMADESGFASEKEARDWYLKREDRIKKSALAREKKYKNDNLERGFNSEMRENSAGKIQSGYDDVTWPKRDLEELSGPVKFTKRSNNQLGIARETFDDFEDYAKALERGDKVPSPIEALRDPRELEKFQLFSKQAKGLDQEQMAEMIQDLRKGKYKDIKNRKAVKDILERMKKASRESLRSDDRHGPYTRRDLKWNPTDSE